MAIIVYGVFKQQKPFDPSYHGAPRLNLSSSATTPKIKHKKVPPNLLTTKSLVVPLLSHYGLIL